MLLLATPPPTETLDSVGQLNYLSGVCCDVLGSTDQKAFCPSHGRAGGDGFFRVFTCRTGKPFSKPPHDRPHTGQCVC